MASASTKKKRNECRCTYLKRSEIVDLRNNGGGTVQLGFFSALLLVVEITLPSAHPAFQPVAYEGLCQWLVPPCDLGEFPPRKAAQGHVAVDLENKGFQLQKEKWFGQLYF